MNTRQISGWVPILVGAAVLVTVFVTLGYWMIGIPLLILLIAMVGGALLYWKEGE